MKISNIMDKNVICIQQGATFKEAAQLVDKYRVSDLMVIEKKQRLLGVLSEGDLIRHIIPDANKVINFSEGDIEQVYDAFNQLGHRIANQSIDRLILTDILTLEPNDEILKAATLMVENQIRRLPVIDKSNTVIATVSRSDICKAMLK